MSDEVEEVELSEEERQAAFEEGRKIARGEMPPADGPNEQTEHDEELPREQTEEETAKDDEAGAKASAEEVMEGLNLTPSEVKALLAKANELDAIKASLSGETQKIYGKFGEVQRELKKLAEGRAKVTKDTFKKLADAGYEDIAELLAEDLGSLPSGQTVDPADIEQRVSGRIQEEVNKAVVNMEIKFLSSRHPDWQDKAASNDWKLWVATQPAERQAELGASKDGLWLAARFDEFDAWKQRGKNKTSRLEKAITPSGAPPEPSKKALSESQAFEEGRKLARQRLGIMR